MNLAKIVAVMVILSLVATPPAFSEEMSNTTTTSADEPMTNEGQPNDETDPEPTQDNALKGTEKVEKTAETVSEEGAVLSKDDTVLLDGEIMDGWNYVYSAYGISWAGLVFYMVSLFWRSRK